MAAAEGLYGRLFQNIHEQTSDIEKSILKVVLTEEEGLLDQWTTINDLANERITNLNSYFQDYDKLRPERRKPLVQLALNQRNVIDLTQFDRFDAAKLQRIKDQLTTREEGSISTNLMNLLSAFKTEATSITDEAERNTLVSMILRTSYIKTCILDQINNLEQRRAPVEEAPAPVQGHQGLYPQIPKEFRAPPANPEIADDYEIINSKDAIPPPIERAPVQMAAPAPVEKEEVFVMYGPLSEGRTLILKAKEFEVKLQNISKLNRNEFEAAAIEYYGSLEELGKRYFFDGLYPIRHCVLLIDRIILMSNLDRAAFALKNDLESVREQLANHYKHEIARIRNRFINPRF